MKEVVPSVDDPEREIVRQVKREYGRYSFVADISKDGAKFKAIIGFEIPRRFDDSIDENIYYKYLTFDNIATVHAEYENKSINLRGPSSSEVSERIENEIKNLRQNLGKEVVRIAAADLVEMPEVETDFSRVRKLVMILKRDTKTDLEEFLNEKENSIDYVELLRSLGYVEKRESSWVESDKLRDKFREHGNDAYKEVIKDIICDRPHQMKQDLNLRNIVPYIELLELYYFIMYQTSEGFDLDVSKMKSYYKKHYGKDKPEYWIRDKLMRLSEKGLIEFSDDYVKSSSKVQSELSSLRA